MGTASVDPPEETVLIAHGDSAPIAVPFTVQPEKETDPYSE